MVDYYHHRPPSASLAPSSSSSSVATRAPLSMQSLRVVAPALSLLTLIALFVIVLMVFVIPCVPMARRRIRRRCFDATVAKHPRYSLKSPVTILRSTALMVIVVTAQVCVCAIAEGGVSKTHLYTFAFGLTSSVIFMLFFVFAGDFSMSFLINVGQLVASIVNFSYINNGGDISSSLKSGGGGGHADDSGATTTANGLPWAELLALASFVHALYWTVVLFNLWMLNDLVTGLLQFERMFGVEMPPILRHKMLAMGEGGSGYGGGGPSRNQRHHNHSHHRNHNRHNQQQQRFNALSAMPMNPNAMQ